MGKSSQVLQVSSFSQLTRQWSLSLGEVNETGREKYAIKGYERSAISFVGEQSLSNSDGTLFEDLQLYCSDKISPVI